MKLSMNPGFYSGDANLAFDWEITKLEKTRLYIQLKFEQPGHVSAFSHPDGLVVKFNHPTLIRAFNGLSLVKPYLLEKNIVPQLTKNEETTSDNLASGGVTAKVVTYSSMVGFYGNQALLAELMLAVTDSTIMMHSLLINVQ